MQIEIGQRRAPRYNLRRTGQRAHQLVQWFLDFEDHARASRHNAWHVAAELNRVAKAMHTVEQNGLARDLVRSQPQRLRKSALCIPQLLGFPSPFQLLPAAIEVADQHAAHGFVEMGLGIVRPQCDRAVIARQRLVEPFQLMHRD
jgi:hypothetical protein